MRTLPMNPEPWMDAAACRHHPQPDIWFAAGVAEWADRAEALEVCGRCPVRAECADLGMATGAEFGIWGGMEPQQLRQMRRRVKRK